MLEHFSRFDSAKQQIAIATIKAAVSAPPQMRAREYGDLARVNLKSTQDVYAQVKALPIPDNLKTTLEHLNSLNRLLGDIVVPEGAIPQDTLDRLELRIFKVKCLDETSGDNIGHDEIDLGGFGVDESGDMTSIRSFKVKDNFDTGEEYVFDPVKRFVSFNLNGGTNWPKTYAATLVLAERDWGGFATTLERLWTKVGERLEEVIEDIVGTVSGLWEIVVSAIAYVLRKFIDWIIRWLKDDVFPEVTIAISIPALNKLFSTGRADSRDQIADFIGHKGHYQVIYDWRLYA